MANPFDKKLSKGSVNYGLGHPNGDHCGICRHFEPPSACEIVRGKIRYGDWCKRFEASRVRKRYAA